jgi:hypothetical protein
MRFDDGNPQGEGALGFNPYQAPARAEDGDGPGESPPGDPVTFVAFHLRTEDLRHFQKATCSLSAGLLTGSIFGSFALGGWGILTSILVGARQGDHRRSLGLLIMSALHVVGATVAVVATKQSRRSAPDELAEEWSIRLTPGALIVNQSGISVTRRFWSSISEIRETPHLIIFLLTDALPGRRNAQVSAHLAPLRAFETPGADRSFLDTARRFHAAGLGNPLP